MVLGNHFLLQKSFREHHNFPDGEELSADIDLSAIREIIYFKNKSNSDSVCVSISQDRKLQTNYFIGVDWIGKASAIYVEPKLNNENTQTDYLKMLFSALQHPEIASYTDDLFEIKWNADPIIIEQKQDLLTPLLVVQYLKLVQRIVRKGLKKSYYKVEHNLYSKVKGKINVEQTIKKNLLKNKPLHTYCSYDEFGLNGLENRLLKKALVFVNRYLPTLKNLNSTIYTDNVFNYINPAFEFVSEEVSLHDVKHAKTNVFYKEYEEAIRLAKLILKKFGYNISNTDQHTKISTPPFWIDMSKLFELYVLGMLKDKYPGEVLFQSQINYGKPDFLLNKSKIIADAKYKIYHKENIKGIEPWKRDAIVKDIRQLSGYGRDTGALEKLGYKTKMEKDTALVKCLIIYPDQDAKEILWDNAEVPIEGFVEFYKRAIKLPEI